MEEELKGNLLLPPPWTGADSGISPEQIEPHLLVRNIEPVRVDIGPIAWEELTAMLQRTPSEQEVDEKRRWLRDSLVLPDAPCFVPVGPDCLSETIRVAAFLANIVARVVVVADDDSVLAPLDERDRGWLTTMEALVVSGDYLPLKHRWPTTHIEGTSKPPSRHGGMIYFGRGIDGWEDVGRATSELKERGKRWSVAIPATPPPDEEIFRLLAEAGCEEVRVPVRSFSQRVRTHLGELDSVEESVTTLRGAQRYGLKTAIMLEVGFPDESRDLFLDSLRTLHGAAHFVDSVYDLRTYWSPCDTGASHDWHDGGANNLNWRRKKGRELAAFLVGEGVPCPWFFLPNERDSVESPQAIHARLLANL